MKFFIYCKKKFKKNFEKTKKYGKINSQEKFLPLQELKNKEKNHLKVSKYKDQELRKMIKKHQKITKFKQKNVILMSKKISVILINKGFY